MDKTKKIIKELIPYVIIFIVVVTIRTYLVTPVYVKGSSMYPTLNGGEIMILNKTKKDYQRYDIVVIDTGDQEIIKRVIALPGEKISWEEGRIYVNGRLQTEEYSKGETSHFDTVTLADDEYFVLGDNRENSKDSRYYGPIKYDQIKGKTKLVIFPFSEAGNVK